MMEPEHLPDAEHFTLPLLAAAWRDCIHGRGRCRTSDIGQINIQPLLPKRVIDLDDSISTQLTVSVRLHESVPGERSDYVVLSHRWGKSIPCKTTLTNLEVYKKDIVYNNLPRTFKDAIDTTRKLGIRYVWIDALCIVQDDHDDWARQAPLMGTIFRNATCTIAAHSAEHSDYGFLSTVHGNEMNQVGLGQSKTAVDKIYLGFPRNFGGLISRSHIIQRGWVQQELILSQRLMHFFRGLVFWECDHTTTPEPVGFTAESHTIRSQQLYRQKTLRTSMKDPEDCWMDFVSHYSACELTYASDKLVAIDGIARAWMGRMEATVANHYRYGHFLHIASSLLWAAQNAVVISKRKNIPSWSWASMKGPVQFMYLRYIVHKFPFRLKSFEVNALIEHDKTTRPQKKSQVVISTHVTAVVVSCPTKTSRHCYFWNHMWYQSSPKGYRLQLPYKTVCSFDHSPEEIGARKATAADGHEYDLELHFAKVTTFTSMEDINGQPNIGYGVLLLQPTHLGSSIFKRVGVGIIVRSQEHGPSWINDPQALKTLTIE